MENIDMQDIDALINNEDKPAVMEERKINKPPAEQRSFEQLGILVLDGSGTMKDAGETGQSKSNEVNTVVRGFIGRLKVSGNSKNFLLSIVTFDEEAIVRKMPTPVLDMKENDDYNPLIGHGGLTAIGNALNKANEIANEFLGGETGLVRSVRIILLTDGKNTEGEDPLIVAERIKNSGKDIHIYVAGYGKSGEIDDFTLMKIGEGDYVRAYTPEALRDFLKRSMETARE